MRIAQVTPVYPPYRGGIGQLAKEYTDRLTALGHTVEVFAPWWKIGNAGFLSWSQLRRLRQFDIIHLHYPFYGTAEQLACLHPLLFKEGAGGRIPMVITYHMDATAEGLKGKVFDLHRHLIQPFILSRAKKILVSSLDYARHSSLRPCLRHGGVVELPFGVDITRFHPVATHEEGELRAELGIPQDVPVLLFVGGLDSAHAFKGLSVLLEALPMITSPFHLVIVGDGNLRPSFESMSDAQYIHFVGPVSDEDLPIYYRMADIHVFPSVSSAEAFGLVALEAASSGIPTVASDLPGVRTVVKNGQTGLTVPSGDATALARAIESLLKNPQEREKLGASARKRAVEEYSWDGLIDRLLVIYRNI